VTSSGKLFHGRDRSCHTEGDVSSAFVRTIQWHSDYSDFMSSGYG